MRVSTGGCGCGRAAVGAGAGVRACGPACLPVCLFVCLFVCFFVCLSVCLSVCVWFDGTPCGGVTLPPNMAPDKRYLEDQVPPGGSSCQGRGFPFGVSQPQRGSNEAEPWRGLRLELYGFPENLQSSGAVSENQCRTLGAAAGAFCWFGPIHQVFTLEGKRSGFLGSAFQFTPIRSAPIVYPTG